MKTEFISTCTYNNDKALVTGQSTCQLVCGQCGHTSSGAYTLGGWVGLEGKPALHCRTHSRTSRPQGRSALDKWNKGEWNGQGRGGSQ